MECDKIGTERGKEGAVGPWYQINQEKIILMVYHHVLVTGDFDYEMAVRKWAASTSGVSFFPLLTHHLTVSRKVLATWLIQ